MNVSHGNCCTCQTCKGPVGECNCDLENEIARLTSERDAAIRHIGLTRDIIERMDGDTVERLEELEVVAARRMAERDSAIARAERAEGTLEELTRVIITFKPNRHATGISPVIVALAHEAREALAGRGTTPSPDAREAAVDGLMLVDGSLYLYGWHILTGGKSAVDVRDAILRARREGKGG